MPRALPWLLLLPSLGLNLLLFFRSGSAAPITRASPATATPPSIERTIFDRSPSLPDRSVVTPPRSQQATPAPSPTKKDPPALALAPIDDALEHDVVCEVALRRFHEDFARERDHLAESLRRDFADPAKQSADADQTAAKESAILELAPSDSAAFADAYRTLHAARVADVLAEVNATPPDWQAVLGTVKKLFSDEDALAVRFAGEEGASKLRAAQLESRAGVVAIAAALADAPSTAATW